jgi:uncharacterized protein (DUF736 family)
MATIGHFIKQENGDFTGGIESITISKRVRFEPQEKRNAKSPDFLIIFDFSEAGAAWRKTGENGEYLSVRLDDPTFAAPINCRLVKSDADKGYNLIWERERKRA